MSKRTDFAMKCHEWNTELTSEQRLYLMRKYGSFEKALDVWITAKESGLINFESI